jgi:hypothetical protein
LLEFTLQRVRRPHKLKLELQLPDDAAPDGAWKSFGLGFYKYTAPVALEIILSGQLRLTSSPARL